MQTNKIEQRKGEREREKSEKSDSTLGKHQQKSDMSSITIIKHSQNGICSTIKSAWQENGVKLQRHLKGRVNKVI